MSAVLSPAPDIAPRLGESAPAERVSAAALDDSEFAAALAALGPFERAPLLAVAVSGGADSLALTLLADRWARARGGAVLAITVDHGLRADSAIEAARVGAWLSARAIDHHIVQWRGAKPAGGVQAAARAARYGLLLDFCRARGALHLLLGHHADDQAETLMLRLVADSGRDGLAGMAAIVETAQARVLRPLLGFSHARLAATLAARGQDWIEDPSNRNPRFARASLRRLGPDANAAAALARELGAGRVARDQAVAALLARSAAVAPEGWALFDLASLAAAPAELGRRALVRLMMTIGGGGYAPRGERLDRLYAALIAGALRAGRTLAGCCVRPAKGGVLVLREAAAIGPRIEVTAGGDYFWDGRFAVRIAGAQIAPGVAIAALGAKGWAAIVKLRPELRQAAIPAGIKPVLPALWDLEGVVEVPHLSYRRRGADPDSVRMVSAVFRPRHVVAGAGFAVLPSCG